MEITDAQAFGLKGKGIILFHEEASQMKKECMEDTSLQDVSGGSIQELEEIRSFIKTHDPAYAGTPADRIDVTE